MSDLASSVLFDGWAQAYDRMRDEVLGSAVRDGGWFDAELTAADLPEIELQSLWFGGAFGREFRDTQGRLVRVVQFGVWNHAAGPDFLHASVEVDGERLVGAIELDTDVRDWEHHGHASNPAYENVVLHLFFNAPERRFSRARKRTGMWCRCAWMRRYWWSLRRRWTRIPGVV